MWSTPLSVIHFPQAPCVAAGVCVQRSQVCVFVKMRDSELVTQSSYPPLPADTNESQSSCSISKGPPGTVAPSFEVAHVLFTTPLGFDTGLLGELRGYPVKDDFVSHCVGACGATGIRSCMHFLAAATAELCRIETPAQVVCTATERSVRCITGTYPQ